MSEIIIQRDIIAPIDHQVTTVEQYEQRRIMRRRRVAKRMAKRFPMFAVELMQDEFPGYTYELFEADVTRKSRKGKSMRHPKSPLQRQGRYPLLQKAMREYRLTKEEKCLEEAQYWRNRLFLPFEVVFSLGKGRKCLQFPSTTSLSVIESLGKIKGFKTWEEWQVMYDKAMEWSHIR